MINHADADSDVADDGDNDGDNDDDDDDDGDDDDDDAVVSQKARLKAGLLDACDGSHNQWAPAGNQLKEDGHDATQEVSQKVLTGWPRWLLLLLEQYLEPKTTRVKPRQSHAIVCENIGFCYFGYLTAFVWFTLVFRWFLQSFSE